MASECIYWADGHIVFVLILVVVEDGLREVIQKLKEKGFVCLNPCCCGRWSQRRARSAKITLSGLGLNPCCCGRWSQRCQDWCCSSEGHSCVLILVVVEDGLRARRWR